VLADADDGLIARLIYIWPDPLPIRPLLDRGDADAGRRRDVLISAARRLRALAMGADVDGTPAPRALRLNEDGRALFDELRREAMTRTREASGLIAGWYGKNPGRALRLALVYELLAWAVRDEAEPTIVSADTVARAGGYLDYAAGMLDRVTAGLAITCTEADAARIARHLLTMCDVRLLNERALYKTATFAWARDSKRLAQALAVLEQGHWIRRPSANGRGRPRGDWEVSPRIWEGRR
jgi:putative DNA primase/helicase